MAPVRLSFSAAGFLGLYLLGAACALRVRGPRLLCEVTGVAGALAGALVAAALVTAPERLEAYTRFALDLAEDARRRPLGVATPGFDLLARLRAGVERLLPPDAHARAQGRLHVSVTRARGGGNRLVSAFATREELVRVLLASCFVPVFAGLEAVEFEGEAWADGALSDALPVPPGVGRAVSVSPFCGGADVSPRDDPGPWGWGPRVRVCNLEVALSASNLRRLRHALFPPPRPALEAQAHAGFRDAARFLRREGWAA